MNKSQTIAILVLVASVLVASTLALLTIQWSMRGTGSIKGVGLGVYWDPQCTDATSSLEFGQLEPGSSKNFALYIRNEGNTLLTLNIVSENWDPANAADYMTLTWNREGQQIDPDEIMGCTITLSVSPNIQGISSFSLDIIISGTG
ncbi:MAG: hypothetical protein ACFE8O_12495 [Candidatus Hermodarchaeota archaeon]